MDLLCKENHGKNNQIDTFHAKVIVVEMTEFLIMQ
jgi:hypothetical protein